MCVSIHTYITVPTLDDAKLCIHSLALGENDKARLLREVEHHIGMKSAFPIWGGRGRIVDGWSRIEVGEFTFLLEPDTPMWNEVRIVLAHGAPDALAWVRTSPMSDEIRAFLIREISHMSRVICNPALCPPGRKQFTVRTNSISVTVLFSSESAPLRNSLGFENMDACTYENLRLELNSILFLDELDNDSSPAPGTFTISTEPKADGDSNPVPGTFNSDPNARS